MSDGGMDRDLTPEHAVVDALLRERLGGERPPELAAAVLLRAARGDAAAAAAKVAAAERPAPVPFGRWVAAALLLLGLAVVVAVAVARRDAGPAPAPAPVQEPQEPGEPEIVLVRTVDELRRLLPQVVGLSMSFWRLPGLGVTLPAKSPAVACDPAVAKAFATALAADLRAERPAGWEWGQELRLSLADGRAIAFAIDEYGVGRRVRFGVRGLQGDATMGAAAYGVLAGELDRTMRQAQAHFGLLVRRSDLAPEHLPAFAGCTALAVVPGELPEGMPGIRGEDLAALATLPRLRSLDLARTPAIVDADALRGVAGIAQLERLVLDGAAVDATALLPLAQKLHLRELSLRGCARLDGVPIDVGVLGGSHFAELERLDLSACTALQASTLPSLSRLGNLRQLYLAGAPLPGDAAAWQQFAQATNASLLDLSGHDLAADALRAVAGIGGLQHLLLRDCALDDGELAVLAAGTAPLRRLDAGGNSAVTRAAALQLLRQLAPLQEIDLRPADVAGTAGKEGDWIELTPGKRLWLRPEDRPQEPQVVDVHSIAQLRELLGQATGLSIEMWQLPRWEPQDLDLPKRMQPYRASPEAARAFAAAFAAGDLRSESAADWKWTNRFRFLLADGRAIEVAFYWRDDALQREDRVRFSVAGMADDVSVVLDPPRRPGGRDGKLIEQAFDAAALAALAGNGILVGGDLAAVVPAYRDCDSLRLLPPALSFGQVDWQQLAFLRDLPQLRRLDLSAIAEAIDTRCLQNVGAVAGLEQLVLDGAGIGDDALLPIGQLQHLTSLSLRNCTGIDGRAFAQIIEGMAPPAPPFQALQRIDLTGCTGLGGFALPNLAAMPALRELRLAGAGLPDADRSWATFSAAARLSLLDLSGHALTPAQLRAVAGIGTLHELWLEDCALDDGDVALLAAARGVQQLHLRGNAAITAGAVATLRQLPQLREVDLRGCGVDGEADQLQPRPDLRIRLR